MARLLAMIPFLTLATGCGFLGNFIQPSTTTVRIINGNGDFPFEVELFYDDDQNILEALLIENGTERNFTIPPGESRSFTVDCDELQAVIINDANLSVIGEVGPSQQGDVLRDGDDFNCGDTIVYTLTGTLVPPEVEIAVSVR
jgi:hypothetical protein